MHRLAIITLGVLGLALAGAVGLTVFQQESSPEGVMCTMEAKLCPDGSAVGRSGSKCEFAPCPSEGASKNDSTASENAFPEKAKSEDAPRTIQEKEGESTISEQAKTTKSSLISDVPFTVQAPFGKWSDPVFQNGCEEASLAMVWYWLSGKPLTQEIAKQEMLALVRFEDRWLGHSVDTSALDTLKLFQDYYGVTAGEVRMDIKSVDIRTALADGAIVIVPANGRKLHNPHFRQPGPERHMLIIIGYDASAKHFITNDPGTRYGERYRYSEDVLFDAIDDYPTGKHLPIQIHRKAMIVMQKL